MMMMMMIIATRRQQQLLKPSTPKGGPIYFHLLPWLVNRYSLYLLTMLSTDQRHSRPQFV